MRNSGRSEGGLAWLLTPPPRDLGGRCRPSLSPLTAELPVIFATDRFVVIDKPSGVLSVPGIGPEKQDCVISRIKAMFPNATGPMMVHRLDMDTSGLLVVGLDPESQRQLSSQFEARTVAKRYFALLEPATEGLELPLSGTITLPLRLDVDRRPYQIVDFALGRSAVTHYEFLERSASGQRIAFTPITGRTHQLRVHAATPSRVFANDPDRTSAHSQGGLGAAIQGDPLYGSRGGHCRLMLHAAELAFDDPATGERVCLAAPVPF